MGKQKVYELAKVLGIDNKVLIEKLKSIDIQVKSHLSVLSEQDIEKINSSNILEKDTKKEDVNKKEKKETQKKENKKVTEKTHEKKAKDDKNVNPVIIRREIQVVEKSNTDNTKKDKKSDIGFVERKNQGNFNLINRNRQKSQVSSIADLLKKSDKKNEPEKVQTEKVEVKKEQNAPQTKSTNNVNNSNNNRLTGNNNYRQNNNNGNNNYNRKPNNNRPTGNNIEKTIKNVVSTPVEKEQQKEYNNKFNKPKQNSSNDDNKKNVANRHKTTDNSSINMDKLKDLKSQKSLSTMFNDSEGGMLDYYDLSNARRNKRSKKQKVNSNRREFEKNKIFELTEIKIPEYVTVKELAETMKKTTSDVIKKLLGLGIMATINQEIDFDTAFLIAEEFGIKAEKLVVVTDEDILFDDSEDNDENMVSRPPVVVVMGHVDHGKTSLLDAIRSTNVIESEAGGITQHIGAYKVKANGRDITFLDTPGHEAFTSMRARGAQVTDIAILVVAADDGIMPQTIEAINHAKAAEIPIIVAINKIDKDGANIERVKESLTEYGLVDEAWGGDTICVPISAKQKTNIDTLLEMVLLVADMKDLKSNPKKQAKGTVIESRLDKNKGTICTLLVQRGTLNIGDTIVVGSVIGKVRVMLDDKGKKIKLAGPSTPVEIIGLPEVPEGGEIFYEVENEKVAKHLIEKRKVKNREKELRANNRVTLDDLFSQIEEGKMKELNIIVKADVQGSVEAVKQALLKLTTDEVRVKIIHANVGAISVSDVTLAKVANAIIIGFNVRPDHNAKDMADSEKVDIRLYSVIYHATEDVQKAMKGMLDPKFKETILGLAEVRNVFKVSNVGTVAGSYVLDGKIVRNGMVRIIRDGVVIYQGKIASLKRFKDDVKEAATGYECGIQIENYNDIKELDQIECYIMEQIKD